MLEIISMLFHNNINNHDIKEDKDVSRFQVTLEWQMVVRKESKCPRLSSNVILMTIETT